MVPLNFVCSYEKVYPIFSTLAREKSAISTAAAQ